MSKGKWKILETLAVFKNRWVTLIGERLLDNHGNQLNYWRIDRPDSVIVIPLRKDKLLICSPVYRPGVDMETPDFPGGRLSPDKSPKEAAYEVLERELGLERGSLEHMLPVNRKPWLVDSSFSSQKLHVFEAKLKDNCVYSTNMAIECPIQETENILSRLICLQCRCAFLDWLYQHNKNKN
ncbi:NUDIX domain-containing protein [uncultured Desulfobacter sp.]|uniref:NUDIX domain-containing protein n=1 Tax=Desulfobacter postgatei TaxID=2293 RepID=UPI00259B4CE2|nr:NUDIX domain-containing protein [uncultured Desulfobacter sp.]